MALVGSLTKQPREQIDFQLDYTTALGTRSDTIASVTSEVSPAGVLTVDYAQTAGLLVNVKVSGGNTGTQYKVTILTTSTAGMVYEDEVNIQVEEV